MSPLFTEETQPSAGTESNHKNDSLSAEISDESVNTPAEASSDLEKIRTVQKLNPACSFQIEKPKFKIT